MRRDGLSLRAKVLRRVGPLALALCLVIWGIAAAAAWNLHMDRLTETLRERLVVRAELMTDRADSIRAAVAATARSPVLAGALRDLRPASAALAFVRSVGFAGVRTRYVALLDADGRPVLLDPPAAWSPPRGLAAALGRARDGAPTIWIEDGSVAMVEPVALGLRRPGALVVAVGAADLIEGLTTDASLRVDLIASTDAVPRVTSQREEGAVQGRVVAPVATMPGVAIALEKRLAGGEPWAHPTQRFLAAAFVLVLGCVVLCALVAAAEVTRPVRALIAEMRSRGLDLAPGGPTDATEIRALRDRLGWAAADLEAALARERESGAQQRQFVAMVSHEFRTPLSIIDGQAGALERRRARMDEATIGTKLGAIRAAVARLVRLIEGALVSGGIENGGLRLAPGPLDPRAVVGALIEERRAISPGARIEADLDGLPDTIEADERLVCAVVDNLLSNAVKYNREGGLVRVVGAAEGEGLRLEVSDEGVGIPEADLPRIGERFFRAASAEGLPGTGIGLHTARLAAELHGGALSVRSRLGEGSTFTLRLPRRAVARKPADGRATGLWRAIYTSVASRPMTEADVAALVTAAQAANGRRGVTGCLLFRDGRFAQAIEGPRDAIDRLLDSLRRDPRHHSLVIRAYAPAEARAYAEWRMVGRAPPAEGDLAAALEADLARRLEEDAARAA